MGPLGSFLMGTLLWGLSELVSGTVYSLIYKKQEVQKTYKSNECNIRELYGLLAVSALTYF